MTFDEYQQRALSTAIVHKDPMMAKTIWVMGVAGEAGEVVEKWKKIVAYRQGKMSDEDRIELAKELGDVVWYVAVLADALGLSFDEVMANNLKKLSDRQKRNVVKGEGDNR